MDEHDKHRCKGGRHELHGLSRIGKGTLFYERKVRKDSYVLCNLVFFVNFV